MREFSLGVNCGIELHCCLWEPPESPVAVVQLIHGVAEHILRYSDFAEFLAAHGILVAGADHPGHGSTRSVADTRGYLHGGWKGTVDCIHTLYAHIRQSYPDIPYFMFGHSMGSFLLRTYLFDTRCQISGAVICGTGWQNPFVLCAGRLIARFEAVRLGECGHSKLLQTLIFDAYNKKFSPARTPSDWISTNNAVVDTYCNDPLCGFPVTTQLCREMLDGMRSIQLTGNLKKMSHDLPVLFVSGDQDPVGDMGRGVIRAADAFRKAGMTLTVCKLFSGMRHEILNEINKQDAYSHILTWISGKI